MAKRTTSRKSKAEEAGAQVRAALSRAVRERAAKNEPDEKKAATRVKSSIRKASQSKAGEGGSSGALASNPSPSTAVAISAEAIGEHPPEEDAGSVLGREVHLTGPSNLDRAVFCRQMATLIEVGIPLLKSLRMLAQRTPNPKLASAIGQVADQVEAGQSLADAMRDREGVFSPLVCNVIRVGERGGILEASLVRLARTMESRADMTRKVASALFYPVTALAVAFVVVALIMIKAVPVFTSVYAETGEDLPTITRYVIGLSNFVTDWFVVWLTLLIAAVGGWLWYSRTPGGRRMTSLLALYLPVFTRISRKVAVARFARTLSGLLTSGIPLTESLSICAETHENVIVGEELRKLHDSVHRGEKMSRPLSRNRIFPPLVNDMISIGEESGTLDRMLERIAEIYEADVDSTLRGLSSIIEPILIVLLGGVVILIALAVMLPYFNLVHVV